MADQPATPLEASVAKFCADHDLTGLSLSFYPWGCCATAFWDGFSRNGHGNVSHSSDTVAGALDGLIDAVLFQRHPKATHDTIDLISITDASL